MRETGNDLLSIETDDPVSIPRSYTCSLLGSTNSTATCATIGGNGTTGQYGELSYCSDAIKLSYIFSAYYESQNRNSAACDFDGNATTIRNRE
jgi:hypothetical protein